MKKALAILCIITICITGSAQMTYKYLNYGFVLVDEAVSVVDTLLPANSFHSRNPTTVYQRGTAQPPFHTYFGHFSGNINGVPYEKADILSYLYGLYARWISDYDNQQYFPYPIADYNNPYRVDDDYVILSVDWYPTIYRIRGDFGTINNDTGRSNLDALKIVVNYIPRIGGDDYSEGLAYNQTFYLIISGFPRYYDASTGITYYTNIYKGTSINGAFYASLYDNLSYKLPYELRSIRDTGVTLSDYMEVLLYD